MGLLGDIYSAIDTKKRQLKGLLGDVGGTVDMGARRFREDQQGLQNLFANAYPMAGDKTVLNSPQQIAQFQREAADKAGEMGLAGATVWHGSPHKFDKFDSSKIGTGEGAQAYGHGLYLAESPDVAKGYKDKLTDPAFKYAAMNDAKARLNEKIAKRIESIDPQKAAALRAEVASLGEPGGALYKVDLPDEHIAKMLDWDKPLSEQAPEVQKALADLQNEGASMTYGDMLTSLKVAPHLQNAKDYPFMHPTGRDIYNSFGDAMMVGNGAKGQVSASDKIKALGIPGIRYLDGGSRGAGTGSSNFVVFPGNEGLLKIMERNGQPVGGLLK